MTGLAAQYIEVTQSRRRPLRDENDTEKTFIARCGSTGKHTPLRRADEGARAQLALFPIKTFEQWNVQTRHSLNVPRPVYRSKGFQYDYKPFRARHGDTLVESANCRGAPVASVKPQART